MNFLLSSLNAADRAAVNETNFQRLDESAAFVQRPTKIGGVPNALVGPDPDGLYPVGFIFLDSLLAGFRCTDDSTPGSWVQASPAIVTAEPASPPPPLNYLIQRPDLNWQYFYWDGAAFQPTA